MKADAAEIEGFLDELGAESWLGTLRSKWSKYLFHYTDIRNAIKILEDGKLICRAELERTGGMAVDSASPSVIAHTEDEVKKFVRFYFRPRTPTQYNQEGIRPVSARLLNSHCAVPIFFLFDAKKILTRSDSLFAPCNLAYGTAKLCSTAEELASFDFQKIYHVGRVDDSNRDTIVAHRNAEVVVARELDLSALKFIYCRSPAERDSLLYLLAKNGISNWDDRIIVDTRANLYFREAVFIQTAQLDSNYVKLVFSPEADIPGPFKLDLRGRRPNGRRFRFERDDYEANSTLRVRLRDFERYRLQVRLDECLAFVGEFDVRDYDPF